MEYQIAVENVSKSFQNQNSTGMVNVLSGLNLQVRKGEFITFFGPNGCGKTTFLKLLAGLERPNEGTIRIDDHRPDQAKIGYIFQNYKDSLFPWLRNIDNIALPLVINGLTRAEARRKAIELYENLNLKFDVYAYPYTLSGGQQQLLAIARALVYDPDVLLMDEPFNALDYQTNFFMEDTLLEIWTTAQKTIIFISHEIDQAIYLADRIVFFTRLPASIKEIIRVGLPRPRLQEIRLHDEFVQLKRKAIEIFKEEVTK